ncbi:uncharacterized protein [Palaemon carinicauda]|uniref:uncharacterized protein n=1 Tax=Palaemon carinicauda TaxID=392227 RepID=UPI0035B64237
MKENFVGIASDVCGKKFVGGSLRKASEWWNEGVKVKGEKRKGAFEGWLQSDSVEKYGKYREKNVEVKRKLWRRVKRHFLKYMVHFVGDVLGDGIRITSLEVPETVDMGEDATLKCCYDLASHDLYSVKWYRDDEEFFRYMPSESPPMATQELNGVSVSKDQSNGDMIVLRNVELNSSGRYKCEVISDAPEFHTADKSAEMMVVVVPEEKPLIHGTQHEYHIGDLARLTCTSARSLPPAQLTWQINGKQAPPEYLLSLPTISFPDGLAQTKLQLKFLVTRSHFKHGEMTLRCSARISTLYYKTQQHSVDGQFNYNVPVMESRDISALSSDQGKARRGMPPSSGQQPKPHTLALLLSLAIVAFLSDYLSLSLRQS